MYKRQPVALSNNTALPEIGEDAGWYFHPEDEDAIRATLRELIDRAGERTRRIELGKGIAARYRWSAANDKLVAALQDFQNRLR